METTLQPRTLILALGLGFTLASAIAADSGAFTPSADLSKARALIEKKDWGAAVSELERAARADRDNADVHKLLGYSLRNAGKLERAISLDPSASFAAPISTPQT